MKNLYLILLVLMIAISGFAQVPGGINYQVVIRNVDGKVLSNENVTIQASITDGEGGSYSESISAISDAFGVVNTVIGTKDIEGELNDLNWKAGNATLSVNVSSGSGSVEMGTTQLLSVPFAFYAANSGSSKEGPAGPEGPQGPQGEPGNDGTGVTIVGTLPSPNDLPNPYSGDVGDMYIIQESGEGYVWDGTLWNPVGQIQGPVGPQGPQGNQGPQGDEGPIGQIGPQGIQGDQGQIGPVGPQGDEGPIGQIGPQGIQGVQGQIGPVGPEGPEGPIGQIGPQGIQGIQGQIGPVGPEGPEGPVGPEGPEGPQGDTGPAGTYTAGDGISLDNGEITNTGDTNAGDDILKNSAAGGDLSGTLPNPTVNRIKGIPVTGTAQDGDVLKYNSQLNSLAFSDDADSNPWTGIPGGINYANVSVKGSEVYFGSTDYGSIQGSSTTTLVQFNDISKLGYYNTSSEWGPNSNNSIKLGSSGFRWSEIWSVNGINQSSDRRLKKEIKPLTYGLQSIMEMEPVTYKWREGNQDVLIGFIAQDMEEVLPEVVQHKILSESQKNAYEAEGRVPGEDMYSMNYSEIIPVLVKAIQEQQIEIEKLKVKINSLEK